MAPDQESNGPDNQVTPTASTNKAANIERLKLLFGDKLFDIEHALNMYATSFVTMPAFGIYEDDILKKFEHQIKTCHIYLIGTLPHLNLIDTRVEHGKLSIDIEVSGNRCVADWLVPEDSELIETEKGAFVKCSQGYWAPDEEEITKKLMVKYDNIHFDILYIGQAYGKDGSRNALTRLKNHETLQKISVKGISADRRLAILMLEIEQSNRLVTFINPWAEEKSDSEARISAGLTKLFETSDAEKIALYEASLIRYFEPMFNREFKESFPSTNLKILQDCYEKDISAVISEICIDELPFRLKSEKIKPDYYHIAKFDLHDDIARQVFFGLDK